MKHLSFFILGLASSLHGQAAVQYSVTLLENPVDPQAYNLIAGDISNSGWVTGIALTPANSQIIWQYSPQNGYEVLGTYPGYQTSARAVNDSGQIAASAYNQTSERPLRYTQGVGFQDLGTLGGTGSDANHGSMGLNASGQVVGYSEVPGGDVHAFRYTDGAGMQDLGTFGGRFSNGYDLNNTGTVTGYADYADGSRHAFLFTDVTGMQDLGPGVGVSINSLGIVAGVSPLFGGPVLFKDGQVVPIGSISGMRGMGIGSINDANVVVGGYLSADSHALAFLATESDGMVDLNTLIDSNSGWLLAGASAINNSGQIVGEGYFEGRATAYRLDPVPEPSTWALLGLGGALAFVFCRKRQR
jgi:probable HAF family extracellular repeat protein